LAKKVLQELNGNTLKFNSSLLTPDQVSEILQVHILTVYDYIKQGKLGAVRLGRSYRISKEDLEKLLELNRVKMQQKK
jgi:excisionase family DNA binding protein